MSIREAVRAMGAYRFSAGPKGIKLDQNESPDDLAGPLREAVLERLGSAMFNRYPELYPRQLERAIAQRHDWHEDGVVVANGSNTLIQAITIVAALGRSLVTVTPTFAVYASQARLLDAELTEVPLGPGFSLPVDALVEAAAGRPGALFLANPAAPSGNLHPIDEVERLVASLGPETLWAVDEAYCEFAGSSHLELVKASPSGISLRTLSKAAGLAGVRLGFALTSPELASELRKVLLPFSVGIMQTAVGLAVLEHGELIEQRVALARSERERLSRAMRGLPGVEPFESVTNFILFRVDDPARVHHDLAAAGVVVRRQDHLSGAEGCLRVSVGTAAENDAFLAALARAAQGPTAQGQPSQPRVAHG